MPDTDTLVVFTGVPEFEELTSTSLTDPDNDPLASRSRRRITVD
jgi:hypothetical protein